MLVAKWTNTSLGEKITFWFDPFTINTFRAFFVRLVQLRNRCSNPGGGLRDTW